MSIAPSHAVGRGHSSCPCGPLHRLPPCPEDMAAGFPQESDPRKMKQEATVPFRIWPPKWYPGSSTPWHVLQKQVTQFSLHSRDGTQAPPLEGQVSKNWWTYFKTTMQAV